MSHKLKLAHSFIKRNMSNIQKIAVLNGARKETFIKVLENETKKTAKVIMQRQPVNGFNLELLQELTSVIKELERKNYRGMILTSSCHNVFSAGLDITELYEPEETRFRKFWKSLQDLWKTLYITPLVTIAAVNGHAPAGGCLLTMSCDHTIMVNTNATIGLPASKLGVPVPKWLFDMYTNALGFHKAEHAVKLGKVFSPEEALKLNIVDELVDSPTDLMSTAEQQLDKWLKIPGASLRWTKISIRKPYVDDLISYEQEELEETVRVIFLEETQQMLKSYLNGLRNNKNHRTINRD